MSLELINKYIFNPFSKRFSWNYVFIYLFIYLFIVYTYRP